MDRQVKQDISIGNYNQENIRVLFQSLGCLNGTLWNTSLYPEPVKTVAGKDKRRLPKMKCGLSLQKWKNYHQ